MGAEGSKISAGGKIPGVARDKIVARWQKRILSTQLFAVARHDERADSTFVTLDDNGLRWTSTDDFCKWPMDPPLTTVGLQAACETGKRVHDLADASACHIHVVISSPYYRCVQTAVEISRRLGPKTKLLIDQQIGEIYGPAVLGPTEPKHPVRPLGHTQAYCLMQGIPVHQEAIGKWPEWPENVADARKRYASRFLTYLHRSAVTKRNFILVSHADCIGVALSLMPSQADHAVSSVEFGGLFVARRQHRETSSKSSSKPGSPTKGKGLVSVMPLDGCEEQDDPVDALTLHDRDQCRNDWFPDDVSPTIVSNKVSSSSAATNAFEQGGSSSASSGCVPDQRHNSSANIGGEEFPSLPCASDGWHVFTHGIELRKKNSSTRGDKFIKKVITLTQGSKFRRDHLENLLGELSELPLGCQQGEHVSASKDLDFGHTPSGRSGVTQHSQFSKISMSTILFGASDRSDTESDAMYDLESRPGSVRRQSSGGSMRRQTPSHTADTLLSMDRKRLPERRMSEASVHTKATIESQESGISSNSKKQHSSEGQDSQESPRTKSQASDSSRSSSVENTTRQNSWGTFHISPRERGSAKSPRSSGISQQAVQQATLSSQSNQSPRHASPETSSPALSPKATSPVVRGAPLTFSLTNSALMRRRAKRISDPGKGALQGLALPSDLVKETHSDKPHVPDAHSTIAKASNALQDAVDAATMDAATMDPSNRHKERFLTG